jgi:predicted MFS family arabinose efflux permease
MDHCEAMKTQESTHQNSIKNLLTRDLIFVFLAFFVFLAANHSLVPTFPIFLAGLGSNEREIGVLVGVVAISALVSRFFVGEVLRRYSERRVMMVGALMSVFAFLACIVFRPFWPLFVLRVFHGIAFACLHTAGLAYSVSAVPPAYRGQGIAYFMLAPNLAIAIAAPFGMFLVNRYSFTIYFLFGAGLSMCALFLSWKVKQRENTTSINMTPGRNNLFIEWKIIVPAITSFLQTFVFGALAAFFPLYAIQCGVANPGHFFSANAVMIIAARILGGRILDTYDKEKMIPIFIVVSMIAMFILSFSTTLPMFICAGLLWGIGGAFFYPASMAYALEYAGSSGGIAISTFQAFMDLGMALGPLVMGVIIPLTGYRVMFLCLVFICLINVCYFQFYVRIKGHVEVT